MQAPPLRPRSRWTGWVPGHPPGPVETPASGPLTSPHRASSAPLRSGQLRPTVCGGRGGDVGRLGQNPGLLGLGAERPLLCAPSSPPCSLRRHRLKLQNLPWPWVLEPGLPSPSPLCCSGRRCWVSRTQIPLSSLRALHGGTPLARLVSENEGPALHRRVRGQGRMGRRDGDPQSGGTAGQKGVPRAQGWAAGSWGCREERGAGAGPVSTTSSVPCQPPSTPGE